MQDQEFSNFWAVHSRKDNRPVFRDWAQGEDGAQSKLESIRQDDGDQADDEYWTVQMTNDEVEMAKQHGWIPQDA